MTDNTIDNLVETRKRVILQVNQGELSASLGAKILGISRQGLWKLRRRVATLFSKYSIGPDRLVWLLDDCEITLSRSTIYRILVRRRLLIPKQPRKRNTVILYSKGYPGGEVQMDTTQPLGKSGPTLITAVDDYSRYGMSDCYYGNKAQQAGEFLKRFVYEAPFPINAVRVDNGSEFRGKFITVCKELRIKIVRNPVRHPTSNGKVERLHRTIEEECFWRIGAKPDDFKYARYWLSRYLSWYNTKRRHGGYGMEGRTPQQRIENWILDKNTPILYKEDVNETLILYMF